MMTLLAAALALQTPGLGVRVENTLPIAREQETVAIAWTAVTRGLPNAGPTNLRVRETVSARDVTHQVLDHDADGKPDSLLFQVTLHAGEVKQYRIEVGATSHTPVRGVHAKFVPEREDMAWESDRIAFRTYGKKLWELENLHSNGIDVWPKRTRALVLDAWYAKGHDGYHVDTGEGADFYQVGPTLGTGGTGVFVGDSLYRGDNFLSHRIIANGPIRLVYELEYGAIDARGLRVTERKRVSMDAGSHFFQQGSTFTADGARTFQIAVGLVKRPNMIGSSSKERGFAWLTGWGPIDPRTRGHGDLGTAVLMDKRQLVDIREIGNHYLVIGNATSGATFTSHVGAGWTSSRDFRDVHDWWRVVDGYAQRLATPVIVTLVMP